MHKKKTVRQIIKVFYTLAVTGMIGNWGMQTAYIERGYQAAGGEYILILVTCWVAWKVINNLFEALEKLEHERHNKKRRDRTASWF